MRKVILSVLLLVVSAPVFAEGPPAEESDEVFRLKQQIADLKLELQAAKREVLQERADRITAERSVLAIQINEWNHEDKQLQKELNALFGCTYDTSKRQCATSEEE